MRPRFHNIMQTDGPPFYSNIALKRAEYNYVLTSMFMNTKFVLF